ncbi:hypothetical protein SBOR_9947 [Sclerotinia borealis F-4128]|uniref:BTB domain-containing protein n=1 Tax=Sclerotinia borealis (strain F-4128) TaxID=1432307 RepID=W9C414_SCLBF|nr:hypothetical protein SBOR_9947 [Sclerotinia borealis F-4128]
MSSNDTLIPSATSADSKESNLNIQQTVNSQALGNSMEEYLRHIGSHLSSEELGSIILRIEVGSSKQPGGTVTFQVHRTLLCTKIPMFQRVFNEDFKEAVDQATKIADAVLADDDPRAFKLLVGWMYSNRIEGDLEKGTDTVDTISSKGSLKGLLKSIKLPIFIKLCILAENYEMPHLQDESIDFLVQYMIDTRTSPNPSCWLEVYKNTSRTSKLRVLFARIAVWQLSQEGGPNGAEAMDMLVLSRSRDLRRDISILMEGNLGGTLADPLLAPACDYHSHGTVDECPCSKG